MKIDRRTFLKGTLATAGLAVWAPMKLADAGLMSSMFGRAGKRPVPLTPNEEFYITSIGVTPDVHLDHWALSIHGLVQHPLTLTYDELLKRPQTSLIATLECIGNPVGGEDISTAKWEGVRLNALLDEAGLEPSGVDLVLRGADDYSDSFPISRALGEEVLIALTMNGVPLPADHGFPARVIVPGLYGLKNVKWLTALEVVNYDYKGYWQREGWPEEAFVKVQSRIDLPGDRETITTKQYSIQGIAFGGEYGIQQVDVSTDLGKTWHTAKIHERLSPYSWVLWSYEWTIPKVGEYTLMVCATNGRGDRQERKLGKIHAITVEAREI